MEISGLHNERVKRLMALQQKAALRRQSGTTVVEGVRELRHCIAGGGEVTEAFVCPALNTSAVELPTTTVRHEVTAQVYARMAYRGTTEGVIAEVRPHRWALPDLQLPDRPLIVVLESVEKPGNLGAVLRSADAARADAVVVCDPLCDLYNPNVVRSSIGAVFTVPCVACSSEECIAFLQQRGIQILTAQLQDSKPYYHTDMRCGTALVMGTESTGLTQRWRQAATAHIRIPMQGRLDSLNVSVSAAVLLFEAVRQRQTDETTYLA